MKTIAALVTEPGKPLTIDEIELPDPKPNQVIVKMSSTGVCLSQVHEIASATPDQCPHFLGHEGTGVVSHVGRDVTHVKEGDSAIVTWVPRSGFPGRGYIDGISPLGATYREELIQGPVYTYGEDSLADEQLVIPISSEDASLESCIVGCAVLTGAGAVLHTAKVRPADSVCIIGAGGIGLSAIKMASLLQAYPVIAVDIVDEKLEFAKQWGATHTVNASAVDPIEAVWEITEKGVDFSFDAIGKREVHEQLLPMTRSGGPGADNVGGMAVLIGWPQKEMTLNAEHFVFNQRQYRGSHGSSIPERDFPMFLRLHREGLFPLDKLVTRQYTLDQTNEAIDDLANGRIAGRSIIVF